MCENGNEGQEAVVHELIDTRAILEERCVPSHLKQWMMKIIIAYGVIMRLVMSLIAIKEKMPRIQCLTVCIGLFFFRVTVRHTRVKDIEYRDQLLSQVSVSECGGASFTM